MVVGGRDRGLRGKGSHKVRVQAAATQHEYWLLVLAQHLTRLLVACLVLE